MKASVITLHTVDNYGSAMQTYATQEILSKFGCEVEIIDYWRWNNLPEYRAQQIVKSIFVCKLPSGITVDNYAARRAACSSAIRCS